MEVSRVVQGDDAGDREAWPWISAMGWWIEWLELGQGNGR